MHWWLINNWLSNLTCHVLNQQANFYFSSIRDWFKLLRFTSFYCLTDRFLVLDSQDWTQVTVMNWDEMKLEGRAQKCTTTYSWQLLLFDWPVSFEQLQFNHVIVFKLKDYSDGSIAFYAAHYIGLNVGLLGEINMF